MWASILKLAVALLPKLLSFLPGSNKEANDQRELGRTEQQNADMKADTVVIRRANDAAKKVDQEEGRDPNDRG